MGDGQIHTQAERDRIITKIRAGLDAGKRVAVTAAEVGISESTFYRWVREKARDERQTVPERGSPYPAAKRSRLIEAIERRVAQGESAVAAAQAVGVAPSTYYAWTHQKRTSAAPLALRPVTVVPAESSEPPVNGGGLVLVTPGGYRLEGLDVSAAAALLKALS